MDFNNIILRIKRLNNDKATHTFDAFFRPNHGYGHGPIRIKKLLKHLSEYEETVHVYVDIVSIEGEAFCFSWENKNEWVEPGATKRKIEYIKSSIAQTVIRKIMPQIIV